jgi:regulator of protease activity HflC (stomatin/prohibitin superfamily)
MVLPKIFFQVLAPAEIIFLTLLLIIIIVVFARAAIKRVYEYERLIVFRLGKYLGEKGPGLVIIIPFIDTVKKVDLRERFIQVTKQTCITKDNAPVDIDFLIYYRVLNASDSVLRVQQFEGAAVGIGTTTLRAVIGDILLDEVLAKRETINQILRSKLDEVTARWGIKITNVEIREIIPPKQVQDAMILQMSAERNRRALITEADGKKTAAITIAEGEKQAAILKAEGERQATILRAEGERQAAILRAEGFALALDTIFKVAKQVDTNTLTLQYFEALKALAQSPATKFIFPMEFTSLITPVQEFVRRSTQSNK